MRSWRLLLAAILIVPLSSCAIADRLSPPQPFSDRSPCVLPQGAAKEQIVQHVNRNIQGAGTTTGLASWQSTSVKVSIRGFPISFPAMLLVEAPRNFRLRVSLPVGGTEVVDVGSNANEFWFWTKDSLHRNVITATHDELILAQQRLDIPFHPDWVMEVLGVIPINAANVTLQRPNPQSPLVELVSDISSPGGSPIRKVIRVDSCHGIIREHALYDEMGVCVASARLADHRVDKETGIITPRVICFDWPPMRQQVTLTFADMHVNPPAMPATVWQVPEKPGYPRLELMQLLNAAEQSGMNPFGAMGPPPGAVAPPAQHQEWDEPPAGSFNGHPSAASPPSQYSPGASRSSSGPPRRGRGLFGWPWW